MGSRKGNQPFDLVWKNIAFIDLREEFRESFSLVRKRKFEKHFAGQVIPIEAPTCTWYGSPEIFLSILLQRAVVGVESYLPTAVYFMALMNERTELLSHEGIRDPYALRGRGTADNYYNRLPSLYDPKFALQTFDVHLWEQTKQFYRDVRNPLFHGYELEVKKGDFRPIRASFKHIEKLYGWLDSWFSIDKFVQWVEANAPRMRAGLGNL